MQPQLASSDACVAGLLCCPTIAFSQTLGAALNFGVVGGSAVTAAVGSSPSRITGDVGVSPGSSITGFPPALGGIVIPPFVLHTANDGPSIASPSGRHGALHLARRRTVALATVIPDALAGQNLGAWRLQSGRGEPGERRPSDSDRQRHVHLPGVELADHHLDVEHFAHRRAGLQRLVAGWQFSDDWRCDLCGQRGRFDGHQQHGSELDAARPNADHDARRRSPSPATTPSTSPRPAPAVLRCRLCLKLFFVLLALGLAGAGYLRLRRRTRPA